MTTLARSERSAVDGAVGLAIFLGATTMLFAAMFLAYAVLRAQAPSWPPAGAPPFPRLAAGLNGLLLVGASAALSRGRRWPALFLGAAFLAAQIVLWRQLVATRLGPGAGLLGDSFLALSAFHAVHVAGGLVALLVTRDGRLRLAAGYWHFVLAIWAVIYLAVCVL